MDTKWPLVCRCAVKHTGAVKLYVMSFGLQMASGAVFCYQITLTNVYCLLPASKMEVMFSGLSVCSSVCLSAGFIIKELILMTFLGRWAWPNRPRHND